MANALGGALGLKRPANNKGVVVGKGRRIGITKGDLRTRLGDGGGRAAGTLDLRNTLGVAKVRTQLAANSL